MQVCSEMSGPAMVMPALNFKNCNNWIFFCWSQERNGILWFSLETWVAKARHMWCTQSEHNFTGSEFACDVGYLLDPGFEWACRNGEMLLWPNTHRRSTDPDCVTSSWCLLLATGKHPRGGHWRRRSLVTLRQGGAFSHHAKNYCFLHTQCSLYCQVL